MPHKVLQSRERGRFHAGAGGNGFKNGPCFFLKRWALVDFPNLRISPIASRMRGSRLASVGTRALEHDPSISCAVLDPLLDRH